MDFNIIKNINCLLVEIICKFSSGTPKVPEEITSGVFHLRIPPHIRIPPPYHMQIEHKGGYSYLVRRRRKIFRIWSSKMIETPLEMHSKSLQTH